MSYSSCENGRGVAPLQESKAEQRDARKLFGSSVILRYKKS